MLDNNFITIQGWMRTKLNLKGVDLMVFAIIYGFSQDGQSVFSGTARYLAEWVGVSRRSIMGVLKKLVDKGLLVKIDKVVNGVGLVDYKVNLESVKNFIGYEKTSQGGYEKTSHHKNSIDNNNNNNTVVVVDNNISPTPTATTSTKKFWVKGYVDAECWAALHGCRKLKTEELVEMAEGSPKDFNMNGDPIWRYGERLDQQAAFTVLQERKRKKLAGDIDKPKKQ